MTMSRSSPLQRNTTPFRVHNEMSKEAKLHADYKGLEETIFDFTKRAAGTWKSSNSAFRHELLEVLCLNRYFDWRKPFEALAEHPKRTVGIPTGITALCVRYNLDEYAEPRRKKAS
jgi:hypothetical protein